MTETIHHTHKMVARKAFVMHVLKHNSPLMAWTQLKTRKGTSTVRELSFGVQNVHALLVVIELIMRIRKKKEEGEEERRCTKSKFSCWFFSAFV